MIYAINDSERIPEGFRVLSRCYFCCFSGTIQSASEVLQRALSIYQEPGTTIWVYVHVKLINNRNVPGTHLDLLYTYSWLHLSPSLSTEHHFVGRQTSLRILGTMYQRLSLVVALVCLSLGQVLADNQQDSAFLIQDGPSRLDVSRQEDLNAKPKETLSLWDSIAG
jgi:hypothetical protein